jgi:hypothetical protein
MKNLLNELLAEQKSLLLTHQAQIDALSKEKHEEPLATQKMNDLLGKQKAEISELDSRISDAKPKTQSNEKIKAKTKVDNVVEVIAQQPQLNFTAIVITTLILVFVSVGWTGLNWTKISSLRDAVENNKTLNIATASVATGALDKANKAIVLADKAYQKAEVAISDIATVDDKVIAIVQHIEKVVDPAIKTLKSKVAAVKAKDMELDKAIAIVNETLGKNKDALIERNKAFKETYLAQKNLNTEVFTQIAAMKKDIVRIEIEKGKTDKEVMKLAYAECTDTKRSNGYSKKECAENYEFVKSYRLKTKKQVVTKTTTINALVLETTTKTK